MLAKCEFINKLDYTHTCVRQCLGMRTFSICGMHNYNYPAASVGNEFLHDHLNIKMLANELDRYLDKIYRRMHIHILWSNSNGKSIV